MDTKNDPLNPNYYHLPNGLETIAVYEWLTANAGAAVKYIIRSSRIDHVVKHNPIEDLRKARWFIDREITRLEQHEQI